VPNQKNFLTFLHQVGIIGHRGIGTWSDEVHFCLSGGGAQVLLGSKLWILPTETVIWWDFIVISWCLHSKNMEVNKDGESRTRSQD
jgi:hypothetical protein